MLVLRNNYMFELSILGKPLPQKKGYSYVLDTERQTKAEQIQRTRNNNIIKSTISSSKSKESGELSREKVGETSPNDKNNETHTAKLSARKVAGSSRWIPFVAGDKSRRLRRHRQSPLGSSPCLLGGQWAGRSFCLLQEWQPLLHSCAPKAREQGRRLNCSRPCVFLLFVLIKK
jgi:hypothetical protein